MSRFEYYVLGKRQVISLVVFIVQSGPDHIPTIALLSAASGSAHTSGSLAAISVGGEPMLQLQIDILASRGVSRFLVEVDHVSGALLQIMDKNRIAGRMVEFVRSGADVGRALQPNDRLWVQFENLYVTPSLLGSLMSQKSPFIATVDGRDENDAFERIDINTRWAGLACVDAATLNFFETLPAGWSMTSSVLRQALQDQVPRLPLPQQVVHSGDIGVIVSAEDVKAVNHKILLERLGNPEGLIERKVLMPVAAAVAPVIWRARNGSIAARMAKPASAALALALAVFDFDLAAIAMILTAIIFNAIAAAVAERNDRLYASKFESSVSWILLGLAAFCLPAGDAGYFGQGALAVFMVVGLLLLAGKIPLPAWAGYLLKSPALIALLALLLSGVLGFTQIMQVIGVAQLGVLVAATWRGGMPEKKDQQA